MRTRTTPTSVLAFIFLIATTIWGVLFGQDLLFKDGFEDPVILKLATFNTYYAFRGSLIDDKYVANPANVATTIDKFNELQIDLAGLQELHDYAALETLAAGTGMGLSAGKTGLRWKFPTAVFSRLPVVSRAWYSGQRIVSEAGIRLPDGTIAYVFSIHERGGSLLRVGVVPDSEIIRRRTGGHPVIVMGDMNGATDLLIELSRGALQLIHNVDIDAILATPHFQIEGEGENHGKLGFSDHPLLVADVRYTPGSAAQAAVPSLEHTMPPGSVWNVGSALVPNTLVLTAIAMTRLPEKGTLKLGEVGVSLDQTIPAASIHGLVYETGPDSIGKDYWTFTIVENTSPAVQVPRWVDVFIQTKISNLRFAKYNDDIDLYLYTNIDQIDKQYEHLCEKYNINLYDIKKFSLKLDGFTCFNSDGLSWPREVFANYLIPEDLMSKYEYSIKLDYGLLSLKPSNIEKILPRNQLLLSSIFNQFNLYEMTQTDFDYYRDKYKISANSANKIGTNTGFLVINNANFKKYDVYNKMRKLLSDTSKGPKDKDVISRIYGDQGLLTMVIGFHSIPVKYVDNGYNVSSYMFKHVASEAGITNFHFTGKIKPWKKNVLDLECFRTFNGANYFLMSRWNRFIRENIPELCGEIVDFDNELDATLLLQKALIQKGIDKVEEVKNQNIFYFAASKACRKLVPSKYDTKLTSLLNR